MPVAVILHLSRLDSVSTMSAAPVPVSDGPDLAR